MRRDAGTAICMLAAITALSWAAPPLAAATTVTVGQGNDPHEVVDAAGTAHIVWTSGDGDMTDAIHYCRLKRGATACDVTHSIRPDNPAESGGDNQSLNQNSSGPRIFIVGDQLVILEERSGTQFQRPDGSSGLTTIVAYTSDDGGTTFSPASGAPPAVVGNNQGGMDGSSVVFGSQDDPRLGVISQDATGGTFFQAISPGAYQGTDANLGDAPGLSRAWHNGNLALDAGLPVAGFTDDNGNWIRRWTGMGSSNDASTWTAPAKVAGNDLINLAGGPSGLIELDYESAKGAFFAHRISGNTAGPGARVTDTANPSQERLVESPTGRVFAAWVSGSSLQLSSSADGVSWPAKSTQILKTSLALNRTDLAATDDGGGFAVVHTTGGTSTEGPIVAVSFGTQTATGKPGLGGLAGGGSPDDDTGATGSCKDIAFGAVDVVPAGGCFLHGTGADKSSFVSDGEIELNGLRVIPDPGTRLRLRPKQHSIDSQGKPVTVLLARDPVSETLWHGPIDANLKKGAGIGTKLFDFDMKAYQAKIGGFPVSGHLPVLLAAKHGVSLPLDLKLPPEFGGEVANIDLTGRQGTGLDIPSVEIGPFDANVGGFGLEGIDLKYSSSDTWEGKGTVRIPEPDGFSLSADVIFHNGKFVHGVLTVTIPFPGVPVTEGVFLSGVDLGLDLEPSFKIGGGATFGAVPAGDIYVLSVHAGLSITIGPPTIVSISGTAALFNIPVANAVVTYNSAKGFSATGKIDLGDDIAGIFIKAGFGVGKVAGHIRFGGSADLKVCGFGVCPHFLQVGFNDIGLAVCFHVPAVGPVAGFDAQGSVEWRGSYDLSRGCNVDKYGDPTGGGRAHVAQAGATGTFVVPAGAPRYAVRVRGMGGPPDVRLAGPDGELALNDPSSGVYATRDVGTSATYLELTAPAAGHYTLLTTMGSPPISAVQGAMAFNTPSATARVSNDGGRRRSLAFRISDRDPQVGVRFSERLATGGLVMLGEAHGSRGVLHFVPAFGPAGRRAIIAQAILPSGRPGSSQVVAHYTAPPPPRPGRVGRLSVRRSRGGLLVRFPATRGAAGFVVRAALARHGGAVVRFAGAGARHVFLPSIVRGVRARVSVTAVGTDGRRGRPRTASVRP